MKKLNSKFKLSLNYCQCHAGYSLQDLERRSRESSGRSPQQSQQLDLFPLLDKHQKPQISSVPGISPKVRNRYQVILESEILGTELSLDEALKLAKGGKN